MSIGHAVVVIVGIARISNAAVVAVRLRGIRCIRTVVDVVQNGVAIAIAVTAVAQPIDVRIELR